MIALSTENIVNIVHIVRGVEPREPQDLVLPVRRNMERMRREGLPGTFLIVYDAMEDPTLLAALRQGAEEFEIGGWFEIVEPMTREAGLPWRGRWAWDYHADVGMSIGYTPEQRRILVDVYMRRFHAAFGYYPHSMGAWILDCVTLDYLYEKYGIQAAAICRDQCGTDGYTLWGGYYSQGYYPSRNNTLCPAQTADRQIPVPVFRMLGSDPIHQYDAGLSADGEPADWQPVITLEPVCREGGGSPQWVDWYFAENFRGDALGFAYAQTGQENSFGWPAMEKGLDWQYTRLRELKSRGKLRVETLGETGAWMRRSFPLTPAVSQVFRTDWSSRGAGTVWYASRYYRINLLWESGRLLLRDLHLFDQEYPERYRETPVLAHSAIYDTLPVVDGYRFCSRGTRAGGRFTLGGQPAVCLGVEATPLPPDTLRVDVRLEGGGILRILCSETHIEMGVDGCAGSAGPLCLTMTGTAAHLSAQACGQSLTLTYNGFAYVLRLEAGHYDTADGEITAVADGGRLIIPTADCGVAQE